MRILQSCTNLEPSGAKWIEIFSLEHSWNEFSNLCVQFATKSRELAQSLNPWKIPPTNVKTNPVPTVPRPPPRRPPHDCGFRRFDPAEARRIQGLYSHSKKRAARKLLNDVCHV